MKRSLEICSLAVVIFTASTLHCLAGPYSPAAGQPGSDAIPKESSLIAAWATSVESITRGPINVTNPAAGLANFGMPTSVLGPAEGDAFNVVSLGDGGQITLGFALPIFDGPGADLAVFENSFADTFLELAVVDVSSNGVDYFRFPAVSLTPTNTQIGSFGSLDPTNLDNLAGNYRGGFGTPFDLADLAGASPLLDISSVRFVRITDVVGSINPAFATLDSLGNAINDPWPTAGGTSGFDLDAVGAMHVVPEPASETLFALAGLIGVLARRGRRRPDARGPCGRGGKSSPI
jgi:hypothetical protein